MIPRQSTTLEPLHGLERAWSKACRRENKLRDSIRKTIAVLRRFDAITKGDMNYEHAWENHPEKPERSPADLIRREIKRLQKLVVS